MTKTPLSSFWIRWAVAAILGLAAARVFGAAPVLDDIVSGPGETLKVAPVLPVGKTLLLPVSATDSDGDPLTFTATSSNRRIFAEVKSGNPYLKLVVSYAGSGPAPAFTGEMEFQLFNDWTPITAAFIAGFAQGGFYDGLKFHRVVEDFVIQGGDPNGTGSGGPGFQFDNEFAAPLVFTGRGQLAMANSGFAQDYRGTNGSQFFVTLGSPRTLDFTHAIFGQLVRGFDVLEKIEAVPKVAPAGSSEVSRPTVDVKIVSAAVLPNNHDAVLVVSAGASGTSSIAVTADDGKGGQSTKTFTVTAQADTANSPPFLEPLPNVVLAKDSRLTIPFEPIDLEFDYFFVRQFLLSGELAELKEGNPAKIKTKSTFEGRASLLAAVAQFNMNGPAAQFDDFVTMNIGVGDGAIAGREVAIEAMPGVALTNAVVARFEDSDPNAAPEDFTAQINWGDGTPLTTGSKMRDSTAPVGASFAITGNHTYARAGVYPVVVEINGNKGAKTVVRSMAFVTAAPFRARGLQLDVKRSSARELVVASFDDAPAGDAVGTYAAVIDWGDGEVVPGTVAQRADGSYVVSGSHTYAAAGTFSIRTDVRKLSDGASATAWSSAKVNGPRSRRLPPFAQTHLIADYNIAPIRSENGSGSNLQTNFAADLVIVNAGNKSSPANTKLRFWLSDDAAVSVNDLPVKIGPLKEVAVRAVRPGATLRYVFNKTTGGDFRLKLPKTQTGLKKHLLAQLDYRDPIADFEKIDKVLVDGPITGVEVRAISDALVTTEEGGQAQFTVVLSHMPTGDVMIPLESSDTSEGTVSPAVLTFTPANAFAPQTVTVTGVPDGRVDGDEEYFIELKAITSSDPLYNGTDVGDVAITNSDSLLQVSPSSGLTTTEAGGAATFFVRLARNPTGNVTISLSSSDLGEGTVSPAALTFTPANGSSFQTVTVTGVDDAEDDANVAYKIQLMVTSAADPTFTGRSAEVAVTNSDNDPTP